MLQLRTLCLFSLLSFRLASALIVPQELLEEPNDLYELTNNDLSVNTTAIAGYDINVSSVDIRSCENWEATEWDYDVAIVGGGPAGLAASMSLGRVARTSLLYDSEEYRNEKTRYMHDVLGQDGTILLLIALMKRQLTVSRPGPSEISHCGSWSD